MQFLFIHRGFILLSLRLGSTCRADAGTTGIFTQPLADTALLEMPLRPHGCLSRRRHLVVASLSLPRLTICAAACRPGGPTVNAGCTRAGLHIPASAGSGSSLPLVPAPPPLTRSGLRSAKPLTPQGAPPSPALNERRSARHRGHSPGGHGPGGAARPAPAGRPSAQAPAPAPAPPPPAERRGSPRRAAGGGCVSAPR